MAMRRWTVCFAPILSRSCSLFTCSSATSCSSTCSLLFFRKMFSWICDLSWRHFRGLCHFLIGLSVSIVWGFSVIYTPMQPRNLIFIFFSKILVQSPYLYSVGVDFSVSIFSLLKIRKKIPLHSCKKISYVLYISETSSTKWNRTRSRSGSSRCTSWSRSSNTSPSCRHPSSCWNIWSTCLHRWSSGYSSPKVSCVRSWGFDVVFSFDSRYSFLSTLWPDFC